MENQRTKTAEFGPFRLNPLRRLLLLNGAEVVLGTRAFDILLALVEDAGRNLTHRDLIERAWPGLTVEESNLRVHISSLRKALGDGRDGARYIENLVGRGYCFVAPVQWSDTSDNSNKATSRQEGGAQPRALRLPQLRSRIVGRDGAIEDIQALLGATRCVSIVGPGGLGKTTVAVALAHQTLGTGGRSVAFLDLSEIQDEKIVVPALAKAVGVPPQHQQDEDAIIAHLQTEDILIVLDSSEHLADFVAPLCQTLWDNIADLHLLVTTREALRIECEQIYHLPPLAIPEVHEECDAESLRNSPAVQMFFDKVALSGFRSAANDNDLGAVGAICRRLDGIPLAIELVASHTASFGFAGTLALLDERHRLRWQGKRTATSRHQTLEAMLDWSYDLLSEHDQYVLQCLSVFVGEFTFPAAQSIATDDQHDVLAVANSITRLVNKSLVATLSRDSTVYFRLLDTTRAYAMEKLVERGAIGEVFRRHAQYYHTQIKITGSENALFGGRDFSVVASNVPNIRVALDRTSRALELRPLFIELCAATVPVFVNLGLLSECENWCKTALSLQNDEILATNVELSLQEGLAISSMFTKGNHQTVRGSIARGLELAEQSQQVTRMLHLLAGNHIFLTRLGDFQGALECGEHCLAVSTLSGEAPAIAMADWMIGCSHHLLGNQKLALEYAEKGMDRLPVASAIAVRYFGFDHLIRALVVLMRTLWLQGKTEAALDVVAKAMTESERQNRAIDICIALVYSSTVSIWSGDVATSEERATRLLSIARQHGLKPYEMVGLALSGQIEVMHDRLTSGVEKLEMAIAYLDSEEHYILTPVFMGSLAKAYGLLANLDKAERVIDVALQRAQNDGGSCHTPELMIVRGEIALLHRPPRHDDAAEWLMRATEVSRENSNLHHELQATLALFKLGRAETCRLRDLVNAFPVGSSSALLADAQKLIDER